jgi:hypothetical protein
MTLLGEALDVIPQGLPLLLPATIQILGIARPHVCALKVVGEDLLDILPTIDQVSRQVMEASFGCVGQVDGEKLDDEEVIVCPTHPAREAIVLQSNAEIGLAILHVDIVGRTETPKEACIMHVVPERFRSWPLGDKAALFSIVVPAATQIAQAMLNACPFIPQ